jgi:hypothetical protein
MLCPKRPLQHSEETSRPFVNPHEDRGRAELVILFAYHDVWTEEPKFGTIHYLAEGGSRGLIDLASPEWAEGRKYA